MNITSRILINLLIILSVFLGLVSCNNGTEGEETANIEKNERGEQEEGQDQVEEAMLSQGQFEALNMQIDSLRQRNMAGFVGANGQLEVPPQNEASVTAVIGANVVEIRVIEGDEVEEGEILAYISHPDIVQVQTDFLNASNQLNFQEKEYNRQQKLYEAGVGSGGAFQRAEAEVQSARGRVQGFRSQLKLLKINPENILNGTISLRVPLVSPIDGAIEEVNVQTGQFVQSQTPMFEVVNTDHVHADLMVFEKDVSKVKVGQEVNFTIESIPGTQLSATIISIGKTFEQDPKAVHVHAEIENKPETLIPGMYVRGRINVENTQTIALPKNAIAKDGGTFYAFTAQKEGEDWSFRPVEVVIGETVDDWVAIKFLSDIAPGTAFAYNNAYYLMAEMQKGEGGHEH